MGKVFRQREKRIVNLKFVISLLVSLFIASCSEYKEEYIDGDDLIPPSPPFWEYFTVEGVDMDQDGVRDDYELEVNESFDEYNMRKAAKEKYRINDMFLNAKTTEEALWLHDQFWERSNCISSLTIYYSSKYSTRYVHEVTESQFNNYWRRKRFNEKFRALMPRGVYSTGSTNLVENLEKCSFEVKDKFEIIEALKKNRG